MTSEIQWFTTICLMNASDLPHASKHGFFSCLRHTQVVALPRDDERPPVPLVVLEHTQCFVEHCLDGLVPLCALFVPVCWTDLPVHQGVQHLLEESLRVWVVDPEWLVRPPCTAFSLRVFPLCKYQR